MGGIAADLQLPGLRKSKNEVRGATDRPAANWW